MPAALFVAASATSAENSQAPEYQPYVLTESQGLPNGLNGRLKADGRSTRGNYSVVVRESQTAQKANPHSHSQLVEAWYVVEGTMTFRSRDMVIEAPPGTFVLVPPTVEHGFNIEGGKPVRLVQIFSPPGFENLFSERLKLPSYDARKEISEQSPQWLADQKDIARRYGAGPADRLSDGIPIVIKQVPGAKRRQLATTEITAGRYELEELTLRAGDTFRQGRREHGADQAWYLLSGELRLRWRSAAPGPQEQSLKAGDFVSTPHGTKFDISNAAADEAHLLLWRSQPRQPQSH